MGHMATRVNAQLRPHRGMACRGKGSSIKLESMVGQAALPRRKRLYVAGIETKVPYSLLRSVSKRRNSGEDLDTMALEQLLRNLQRHEDSWPFVRWKV